jgi:hypothetical protein
LHYARPHEADHQEDLHAISQHITTRVLHKSNGSDLTAKRTKVVLQRPALIQPD